MINYTRNPSPRITLSTGKNRIKISAVDFEFIANRIQTGEAVKKWEASVDYCLCSEQRLLPHT